MWLLICRASETTLRVRNTDTVRMLGKWTAAVRCKSPVSQLVLTAATSLVMLTVQSERFALLVLMVLSSGFIRGRCSYVVRITGTLHHRLWHDHLTGRIWISAHDQGSVSILYIRLLLLLLIIIDISKVERLVILSIIQRNLIFFQLGCRFELFSIVLIKLFIFIGVHFLFTCIKSKV